MHLVVSEHPVERLWLSLSRPLVDLSYLQQIRPPTYCLAEAETNIRHGPWPSTHLADKLKASRMLLCRASENNGQDSLFSLGLPMKVDENYIRHSYHRTEQDIYLV
jgi:hypothetical protein